MKHYYLITAFLFASLAVKAVDYNFLVVALQDGSEQALPVNGLTLVFSDDVLTAQTESEKVTFPQSALSRMYFSETELNSIDDATATEPVTIRVVDRMVQVSAKPGSKVVIANMGGMLIDRYVVASGPVNTPLRPGLFVVKVDNKSVKVHIK